MNRLLPWDIAALGVEVLTGVTRGVVPFLGVARGAVALS